jgi:hypothetical protein
MRLRVKVRRRNQDNLRGLSDEPRLLPVVRSAFDQVGSFERGGDGEAGGVDEDEVGALRDGAARREWVSRR